MPLYIGNKKVCPIVPTWRGFWSVTVYGFPGTIVDCGTQKTIGEDGKASFRFAEAGTYTFIGIRGTKTEVKEIELVEGEYFVEVNVYAGFAFLQYIEAQRSTTDANYIDLGMAANQDTITKLDCQISADSTTLANIFFGARTGSTSNSYTLQHFADDTVGMGYGSSIKITEPVGTERHVFYKNKNLQYIDDYLVGDLKYQTFTTPYNIRLFFGGSTATYASSTMGMKVYSLQIWQDTDLVRDMVPVKDTATGQVGMWDRVENKLYTSVTGYNYIPGPEVA